MFRASPCNTLRHQRPPSGFTLIELMVVIAILAIVFALALPVYSNYTIRARISDSLDSAETLKANIRASCRSDLTLMELDNARTGYQFIEGMGEDDYVSNIEASGSCSEPVIVITTKNTGQSPNPTLRLEGNTSAESGQASWACSSENTPDFLLPPTCRSS